MAEAKKDTIYVDVDDEITSIVEKVQNSKSAIVALVLPKRAAVLQSIVNMKLLKRASDDAEKRVVLITSEAGLMPLAGAVGMYVAKNLQSKPEIPAAPDTPEAEDDLLESEDEAVDDAPADDEISDDDVFEGAAAPAAAAAKASKTKKQKAAKKPKDKKNKVPNFDSFRKRIIFGALGVVGLLVLLYIGFFVAPKATIVLKTENSSQNSTIEFTADTNATEVDVQSGVIPAEEVEQEKTESQKVPATGEKDLGTKATGTVTFAISCADVGGGPPTIPAGTGISTGDLTYITNSSASLVTPSFSGGCKFTASTAVTAQQNGDKYNINAGRTFSVNNFSSVTATNANGFSGGTTKMAKVVSKQDIDSATQKISGNTDDVKNELKKQLEDKGYYALTDTFRAIKDEVSASPKEGEEASEVTVTANRVYAMTGVKYDDLKVLVEDSVKPEMEQKSLQVQDYGIDQAVFRVNKAENGKVSLTMQAQVVLGPKLDETQFKQDIAGKKKGDVQNIAKGINGVQDAEVKFSPFWVSKVPKNTDKITITYQEASQQ